MDDYRNGTFHAKQKLAVRISGERFGAPTPRFSAEVFPGPRRKQKKSFLICVYHFFYFFGIYSPPSPKRDRDKQEMNKYRDFRQRKMWL